MKSKPAKYYNTVIGNLGSNSTGGQGRMRAFSWICSCLKVFSRRATTESRGGRRQLPSLTLPRVRKHSAKVLRDYELFKTFRAPHTVLKWVPIELITYVNAVVVSIVPVACWKFSLCVIFPSSCLLIVGDCGVFSYNDVFCFHSFRMYLWYYYKSFT